MSDDKKNPPDRVDRKLTEIGSSLADLLRSIRERRMTLGQIRQELDAVRVKQDARAAENASAAPSAGDEGEPTTKADDPSVPHAADDDDG